MGVDFSFQAFRIELGVGLVITHDRKSTVGFLFAETNLRRRYASVEVWWQHTFSWEVVFVTLLLPFGVRRALQSHDPQPSRSYKLAVARIG